MSTYTILLSLLLVGSCSPINCPAEMELSFERGRKVGVIEANGKATRKATAVMKLICDSDVYTDEACLVAIRVVEATL